MIGPSPYFTLWQVATKWAEELNKPVMDVVQILRGQSAYQKPYTPRPVGDLQRQAFDNREPCPEPALKIRPIGFIGATGNVDEYTVLKATRQVLKDNAPSLEELKPGETRYRSAYWTPENVAALTFLNSAECPPEPTEEIKNLLSRFGILRDDFRKWLLGEGQPLPRFWFPEDSEECGQHDERSPVSVAAAIMRKQQTAEADNIVNEKVDEIMNKIHDGVMEIIRDKRSEKVINHLRFISEAKVPGELSERVKKAVLARIKKQYSNTGLKPLSRAPKKEVEPFFM